MNEFVTVEEMRALEANADYFGVGFGDLMENAGRAAAEAIAARYPPCRTLVVCGKGNNGGDGFVVARLLALKGYMVSVLLLGRSAGVKKGPAADSLYKLRFAHIDAMEIEDPAMIPADVFEACDLIVDAILGTGSRGPPRGLERRAIDLINGSRAVKVSIDVPSGLDTYTGVCSGCVLPDLVVTFHAPKKGLEMYNYVVADIGIPEKASRYAGPGDLMNIRTRGDCAHKGECGRVLVVGGGPYTGAPALVAMAALRAGAGWVTVAAPQRAADIVASFSPDLITVPLTGRDRIVMADADRVARLAGKHDVVVVGNGAGRDMETLAAIREIIGQSERVVIDADALQPGMPLHGIVTPHPEEFSRISGVRIAGSDHEDAVRTFSAERRVVTLLKSRPNVVSDGERVRLNGTGNPGMAVGGTGDVLAGITAAFYCRNGAFEAAVAAAFVGGAAGDMACEDKGYWLTATDLIEKIPYVMKKYRLK
ncbi:MAG: putative carbohydrate kinase [Methanocella sp. PtaU1.Bin125]|nr:MAG: putative carbohydrate kinase [Methanocella sp. PtaU1.Bin125]